MQTVFLLIRILYCTIAIACLLGPVFYILWTGKFKNGVFMIWGVWFLFCFVNALLMPVMNHIFFQLRGFTSAGEPGVAFFGALVVGLLGWIPGLIISSFAVVARDAVICLWRFVFSHSKNKESF